MGGKLKFVIIGLLAVGVILGLVAFLNLNNEKQLLSRDNMQLKEEKDSLVAQVNDALQQREKIKAQAGALKDALDRIAAEKDDFQKRYELADRERAKLIEKVKELSDKIKQPLAAIAPGAAAQEASVSVPQTDNAYWAGMLQAKTDLEFQITGIRNELKDLQISNEQLQRDKSSFALEVSGLTREAQDLKRQLQYGQRVTDSIAQDLVREKNYKMDMEESIKPIKQENYLLRRQLAGLNSRKIELDRRLYELQKKNKEYEARFSEMDEMLQGRLREVDTLKSQVYEASRDNPASAIPVVEEKPVELPPIVVKPKQQSAPQAQAAPATVRPQAVPQAEKPAGHSLRGKVVAFNKDNNFVVIDLGEEQGVKTGDAFKVYRNDNAIASVEVIQLRRSISACDIKQEKQPVRVGDSVR